MKTILAILAALAVLTPVGAAAQTMYKCVQNGKITFQTEGCPADSEQIMMKSYGKAPPTQSEEDNRMIEFMSTYRACADGVQIWRQEMGGPYEEWRSRNSAAVSRIEGNPQLQELYKQRVDAKRNGKAGMCRSVGLELRGKQ